eukprot:CAMPEP_0202919294 /NCGR_PEP_ID=MMETSP1392-20130828/75486_1 /ASSEMBLY_ACC=CAM_ASM_000868 /TAXON_ID=225041 /ORGANISM="Chlamydomonas chlamydogama, Strain SAG 11-48b" /LENGTH=108 /DNA_ID=CAMNT_0049612609 /DNA_START=55 /DNA_END=378 /DNA_ORIENTATION=+
MADDNYLNDEDEYGEDDDIAEQPKKRARYDVFKAGTIKKIRVHDFMTYSGTVTITPGPRLNLVIGPNGTGKSSLVCALCVGLGGGPRYSAALTTCLTTSAAAARAAGP